MSKVEDEQMNTKKDQCDKEKKSIESHLSAQDIELITGELGRILLQHERIDNFNVMRISLDIISFMIPLVTPGILALELMLMEMANIAIMNLLEEENRLALQRLCQRDSLDEELELIMEGIRCVCNRGNRQSKISTPVRPAKPRPPPDWGWKGECTCVSWRKRQREAAERAEEEEQESDHPSEELESMKSDTTDCHVLQQFLQLRPFAEVLVDEIITNAQATVVDIQASMRPQVSGDLPEYDDDGNSDPYVGAKHSTPMIPGPVLSIANFTPKIGWTLVDQVVSLWNFEQDWIYCIDYLRQESDTTSDYHTYEVIWSMPTAKYPIPQATVSVFFKIEVSRIIPKKCYVNVTYQFEGNSAIYELKAPIQHEAFLNDILAYKMELFRRITF